MESMDIWVNVVYPHITLKTMWGDLDELCGRIWVASYVGLQIATSTWNTEQKYQNW